MRAHFQGLFIVGQKARSGYMPRTNPLKKAALVALLAAVSCTIGSGDGTPSGLNISWFGQLNAYYCAPASIQMWAFFDGSRVSQNTIAAAIGTVAPSGTPAFEVAPGVNKFTGTHDAILEDAFFTDQAEFFSMQITSINNERPFIGTPSFIKTPQVVRLS
jgi:hypothetical protein